MSEKSLLICTALAIGGHLNRLDFTSAVRSLLHLCRQAPADGVMLIEEIPAIEVWDDFFDPPKPHGCWEGPVYHYAKEWSTKELVAKCLAGEIVSLAEKHPNLAKTYALLCPQKADEIREKVK